MSRGSSGFFRRLLGAYDAAYAARPCTVAFVTCACKSSVSDVVAQQVDRPVEPLQKRFNDIDWSRVAKFSIWGGAYCGIFQHFLYNILYPRWFKLPDAAVKHAKAAVTGAMVPPGRFGKWAIIGRTLAFELFVHFPFIANPVYYVCNALFTGSSPMEGLRRYKDEFWKIMGVIWAVWLPAHTVTFAVMPANFRVGWVATVSLAWLVVLSYLVPMTSKAA